MNAKPSFSKAPVFLVLAAKLLCCNKAGSCEVLRRQEWFVNCAHSLSLLLCILSLLQLHISVSPERVKLNVDCQEVAEKPIKEANNITLDGYEVLGKLSKSGGGRKQSATVSEKNKTCEKRKCLEKHIGKSISQLSKE